ncbi:MAG TPA: DUF1152 domain-containing protein [Verrucomicrobiae bacterium]|nr:DUF1152 domain-containing protein [Verrucomicrobiae bacterium]
MNIALFRELDRANTILICGAGGGYDVFCGLPILHALKTAGKTVHLASLSSGALAFCDATTPVPGLWEVTATTGASKYFPEMHLAGWLSQKGNPTPIYCIAPAGARQAISAYNWLTDKFKPDAIVLIDGGTDSLMRGDESGLATPEGDAVSLLAASQLHAHIKKYLVCLGFGIDAHHGVCHAHFLENVAALAREDAFLGAWSLLHDSPEFAFYRDACEFTFARLPLQPSIVNTSIIAAVNGSFGNVHSTKRTEGSELFINPLMALYWSFHLENVARRNLYLDKIRDTNSLEEVALIIEKFRDELPSIRPQTVIPL